jgi:CBS domain containing-hemolysin-like protein
MNVASFLTPKSEVEYLYDDYSLRQCIEKMTYHGYSAIPVLKRDGSYATTISQSDLLTYVYKLAASQPDQSMSLKELENVTLNSIQMRDKNPPCPITTEPEDLVFRAMEQNFIPVVDDWGTFIGIVKRKDILYYLATSTSREI